MSKKIGAQNPMVKVLDSGLEGIHETIDVLSRLWRILLFDSNLKGYQWHSLLTKWEIKTKQKNTEKAAASQKGNTTRMLAKNVISWKSFMRGLAILEYDKMDIKLTLWKGTKYRELKISVSDISSVAEATEDIEKE